MMKYVISLIVVALLSACGGSGGSGSSVQSNQLTLAQSHTVMAELNGKTVAPLNTRQSTVLTLITPAVSQ